jgi:hypothetical protein
VIDWRGSSRTCLIRLPQQTYSLSIKTIYFTELFWNVVDSHWNGMIQ